MAFISVTRLRLRSPWQLPTFIWYAIPSNNQAKKSAGNLGLELLNDAKFTYWTKSAWQDEASMKAFMLSGAHRKAMPKLLDLCDEAAVAHWEQETASLPDWNEAYRRLVAGGRKSKVRHPSTDHEAFKVAPPKVQVVPKMK